MNHKKNNTLASMLLLVLLLWGQAAAPAAAYEISDYRAVFAVRPGTGDGPRDVDVRLRITYRLRDEEKSDGYKFVGKARVSDASATDETGQPLPCRIEQMREMRVFWSFPAVRNGTKTVDVSFLWHGGARVSGSQVHLHVPWVGIFRVPVERATYELRLPPVLGKPDAISPGSGSWRTEGQEQVYRVTQMPLRERAFDAGGREPLLGDAGGATGAVVPYLLLAAFVILAAWMMTRLTRGSGGTGTEEGYRLTPTECALATGGVGQAVQTALLGLIQKGYLEEAGERVQRPAGKSEVWGRPEPLEEALRRFVGSGMAIRAVLAEGPKDADVRQACAEMEDRMRRAGLLLQPETRAAVWLITIAGALVLFGAAFAWPAAWGGLSGDDPERGLQTTILVALAFGSVIVLDLVTRARTRLTPMGKQRLADLKIQHRPVASANAQDPEMLYWMALFGVGALTGTAYAHLIPQYRPPVSTGGSSGSGCSSGSSCGGSSCGGGGCGGGGCGGCGS